MSPTRVGIDLCAVDEVEDALARFGDAYLQRVFTPSEVVACAEGTDRARRLAARFAAKEATVKALRPDDDGIDLRSIEIDRQPGGWCEIRLSGRARVLAEDAGLSDFAVSLSHEGGLATAVVVATDRHQENER